MVEDSSTTINAEHVWPHEVALAAEAKGRTTITVEGPNTARWCCKYDDGRGGGGGEAAAAGGGDSSCDGRVMAEAGGVCCGRRHEGIMRTMMLCFIIY